MPCRVEQLRRVFEIMRPKKPHWPESFEEAIRQPFVLKILGIMVDHPDAFESWRDVQSQIESGNIRTRATFSEEAAEPSRIERASAAPKGSGRRQSFDWKKRQANDADSA